MNIFKEIEKLRETARENSPPASVTVLNKTPSSWGARIIEIGATFRFQKPGGADDGNDIVQQNVSLNSEQSATLTAHNNKCCYDIFVAAKVEMPNQQTQVVSGWLGDASPQFCKLHCNAYIGPKSKVSIDKSEPLFELHITH
jgi:hypothetical protein